MRGQFLEHVKSWHIDVWLLPEVAPPDRWIPLREKLFWASISSFMCLVRQCVMSLHLNMSSCWVKFDRWIDSEGSDTRSFLLPEAKIDNIWRPEKRTPSRPLDPKNVLKKHKSTLANFFLEPFFMFSQVDSENHHFILFWNFYIANETRGNKKRPPTGILELCARRAKIATLKKQ